METKPQGPKGDDTLSSLNTTINALDLARDTTSMKPAGGAFGSASVLLTVIRDSMINEVDCVELGLACADACKALHRWADGKQGDHLSQPILEAIEQLTTTVTEIQRYIVRRGKRNAISRRLYAKDDKKAFAAWRSGLLGICRFFDAEIAKITDSSNISDVHYNDPTHATVSDSYPPNTGRIFSEICHDALHTNSEDHDVESTYPNFSEGRDGQNRATHASAPSDSPPPLPRIAPAAISDIRRDVVKTRTIVSELQHDVFDIKQTLKIREDDDGQNRAVQDSVSGELPPPPPRIFFGRDELIEEIVGFMDDLAPIALIGAGGIGKTSVALTVLHDDRIKRRFGGDRWFIRCDQFPASLTNFLHRLSKAIGAGIENPEDMTPLRSFLSSKEMLIVLDNAESVLDPQGPHSKEIYDTIEELSLISSVCLCITSRISTIPPTCETLEIPTLSMGAAQDTFHRIHKHAKRSGLVDNVLTQLDFHPLSITLLATVAHHNKWDTDRLASEWERRRTGVLETKYRTSLATAIELSLASPMFQDLGSDARELLGVIAFFPQGVNERSLDWLFPVTHNTANIFDNFCILSLTHRSNGFITMLAPLRDYLFPKNPLSSPLLCITRDRYFSRLAICIHPDEPEFAKSQWITLEDVNVEHLLDAFTSIDVNSEDVWDACAGFMSHLYWHKPRLIVLGHKIERLPDDHPSKPRCLFKLSKLFGATRNFLESKRLLMHAIELWGDEEHLDEVALDLLLLAEANRPLNFHEDVVQLGTGALRIFEELNDPVGQVRCLSQLALSFHHNGWFDAAEETVSHAITLLPENGEQQLTCQCHRILGDIHWARGNTMEAIEQFEIALRTVSPYDWVNVFWSHYALVLLFIEEDRLDDANTHLEHAKLHAVHNAHDLAFGMHLEAYVRACQGRFEEAECEALRAVNAFEKLGLGTSSAAEFSRKILSDSRAKPSDPVTPDESGSTGNQLNIDHLQEPIP